MPHGDIITFLVTHEIDVVRSKSVLEKKGTKMSSKCSEFSDDDETALLTSKINMLWKKKKNL